jgi:hypothetical protein
VRGVNKEAAEYLKISEVNDGTGIEIKKGVIKTDLGTIRIPKHKLKTERKQETPQARAAPAVNSRQPEDKKFLEYKEVIFSTELGDMKGFYYPVVDTEGFVILGLSDNSFVPKSYKESPNLRFSVIFDSLSYNVVFTGCRWRDPETNREQIILMKV